MKNNIILFLIIFSIGIITTCTTFLTSHALDSYCTICAGYNETAQLFFSNGSIVSGLLFMFYDFINLPFDSIGFVSAFFTNVFLSLSIIILYNNLQINKNNVFLKIVTLLCIFTLFYNPFIFEFLLLDEGNVMALGIFLITLAANFIKNGGIKNYFIALLFTIGGVCCYQGIACYLFPLVLLLSTCTFENNKELKTLFIKLCVSFIIYLIAFIFSFVTIKLVGDMLGESILKITDIDVILNFEKIITILLPETIKHLFSFTNVIAYYLICAFVLVITCYLIFKSETKKNNFLIVLLLIFVCVLTPFLPNLVMGELNYTAARMTGTIAIIPSVLSLFIILKLDTNNKTLLLILIMITLFFAMNTRYFIQNGLIDSRRYKEDISYLNKITEKINAYENENNIDIKKIEWFNDSNVNYYYDFGYPNGANTRVFAVDWAFECALNGYTNKKYTLKKMDSKVAESLFDNKNYNEIDDKQFVFEEDTLFILIY